MLRWVFTLVILVASTVLFGTIATAGTIVRPGSDLVIRMGRWWARAILAAAGTRVRYEGLEHIPRTGPCLFVGNHQSTLDIMALLPVLPEPTRFIAKRSLFRIPVLGWSLAVSGFIPIERNRRERALEALERAAQTVRAGRPLVLFAEGTRSVDGRLQPFKKGAFHLALRAGVPVIPVAISGSFRAFPPGGHCVRPGKVRVSFAPPVEVGESSASVLARLMGEVRRAIRDRLDPEERGETP